MKILLVDDHVLFRDGLKALLSQLDPDVELCGAGTCEEALACVGGDYALVLLDLKMPGRNGLDALAALREAAPTVSVVVLSGEDDPATIRAAIERGAMGFIPKSSTPDLLVHAMRLVLAGEVYLPRQVLDAKHNDAVPLALARPDVSALGITPRQLDVLRWVIQGKPNKVIARELGIADGTVKQHVSAVLRCLGASNRVEAVYAAAKLGLRLV